MPPEANVLIAGAGPAGAVTALLLAQAGLRVVLIDPCRPIAPRLESLPENGQMLVRDLGLEGLFAAARARIACRMGLVWRAEPETRDFGAERPWLMTRPVLHAMLRSAALSAGVRLISAQVTAVTSGAMTWRNGDQTGTAAGQVCIDARGRSAGGLQPLGPPRAALPFRAFGKAAHDMGLQALPQAWVWWAAGLDGVIDGAVFARPEAFQGTDQDERAEIAEAQLRGCDGFDMGGDLRFGRPVAASLSAAPKVLSMPRVLRIGDAALARDPVGAHGLTHALRSAAQASAAVQTWIRHPDHAGAADTYLQDRFAQDCKAAQRATHQAYRAQSRHVSAFWSRGIDAAEAEPAPRPMPEQTQTLRLSAKPMRVPLLAQGHIQWTDGLMTRGGEKFARIGPFPAACMLAALSQPAPVPVLQGRLAALASPQAASAALAYLWQAGGLVPVPAADMLRV